ncbi:hypothetical protein ACIP6Q_31465 [Streptomyces bobili]
MAGRPSGDGRPARTYEGLAAVHGAGTLVATVLSALDMGVPV